MKSIEGLTIEELKAVRHSLAVALSRSDSNMFDKYHDIWVNLILDIHEQIKDQEFEQERKDNLPIEP